MLPILILFLCQSLLHAQAPAQSHPAVPRTWTDRDVISLELPLANPAYSPLHISEDMYYRIPARTIYKNYPVYHPSREPAGYMEWLKQQEPQIAFDSKTLSTPEDWIAAGDLVFNAPTSFNPVFFGAADVRDPLFYQQTGMPVAADGTIPFARWVVRKKGEIELGSMGCGTCHIRVLADGKVVPGAQGNNPGDRQGARLLRRAAAAGPGKVLDRVRGFARQFELPWLPNDPNQAARAMSLEQFIAAGEAIPPGVTARSRTSMFVPPQIPDLIGVKDRIYLDHTGLVRHRGIADLMRYSSLSQDVGGLARDGESQPPPQPVGATRYSDEQLYALALYLYALQPPKNPNRRDAIAVRGQKVFEREGCPVCHTPPLYTSNKLIAVDGFSPAPEAFKLLDIVQGRLGTDARYTLETRKGTGYYKVPSLKGVWYRGPFEHNGSVATLEDWFNPARLRDDYQPTGFRGYETKRRAVPGHEFGLKLNQGEKTALLAFLRTL